MGAIPVADAIAPLAQSADGYVHDGGDLLVGVAFGVAQQTKELPHALAKHNGFGGFCSGRADQVHYFLMLVKLIPLRWCERPATSLEPNSPLPTSPMR